MPAPLVAQHRRLAAALAATALLAAGCDSTSTPAAGSPSATTTPSSTSASPTASGGPSASATEPAVPVTVPGGPTLLGAGMTARKVADIPPLAIRLLQNPADKAVYLLHPQQGLSRVNLTDGSLTPVSPVADIVDGVPSGMTFGPDGTAYVVGNKTTATTTHGVIRRGTPDGSGGFAWSTLATSDEYPLAEGPVNHSFNGVVVSPDNKSIFVNSGSRTDHGEVEDGKGAFPNTREVPLTSAIFKLPATAKDLKLKNSVAALAPYLYADGVRNAYSLAFASTGELFAIDNGPDADLPDELNLIEQGGNYGFPWRFGSQDNPQSKPGYDPAKDVTIQPASSAAKLGRYLTDPTFPKSPGHLTDALANKGPSAVNFRGDDGTAHDAAKDGVALTTFTPHRSPLGLVFTDKSYGPQPSGDLHALLLSWGASIGDLPDQGQDLQAVDFVKTGSTYTLTTNQLATGFKHPIDQVLVDGHLYVLEMGDFGDNAPNVGIWEITFA